MYSRVVALNETYKERGARKAYKDLTKAYNFLRTTDDETISKVAESEDLDHAENESEKSIRSKIRFTSKT